jgi:predicted nucleic acid-binding protein
VPGPAGSEAGWGRLPLLVDTSAWARAHHPDVRVPWTEALLGRRLRLSPAARLEILFGARDGETSDLLAERLAAISPAPLTPSVVEAATAAMREMTHRSAGAQRLPIVDYLLAAAAQELGAAVIHYDHDYDVLAEVMEFESVWLAPPGTLP